MGTHQETFETFPSHPNPLISEPKAGVREVEPPEARQRPHRRLPTLPWEDLKLHGIRRGRSGLDISGRNFRGSSYNMSSYHSYNMFNIDIDRMI